VGRVPFSQSLVTRLTALTVGLATLPAAAMGIALLDINREALDESARELQIVAVDDLSRTLDSELERAEQELQMLARVLSDPAIADEGRITLATAQVESSRRLDLVSVYDASGGLIDSIRMPSAREQLAPEQLAEGARETALSEHVCACGSSFEGGEARTLLVVPIESSQGVTGFLRAPARLGALQERIERVGVAHFSSREGLLVVDEEARVVAAARPGESEVGSTLDLSDELFGIGSDAAAFGLARSGTVGDTEGRRVATAVTLPHRKWVVVAQTPVEVAYRSYYAMRRVVLGAALVIMLLAGVVAAGMARRITDPLVRLVEFSRHIARRNFDQRSGVEGRGEVAVLGHALDSAASELLASEAQIREETEIRRDLGRYLPAELVDRVVRREQDMGLGGTRRELTVLFADVVAFTPLTEKLPPEAIVEILNELFTICTEIIFRHGGTVDKFIGDSVMAIWGAPEAHEEHARDALRAAQDMLAWLEIGNRTWRERFGIQVRLAIGVNTGECVVGNIGSESRMEYTAIGDVVNVAARLEAIARPQQILVSGATRDAAGGEFDYVELGAREITGREGEVSLYEVQT
jgi:class 3 adenylate cyclase